MAGRKKNGNFWESSRKNTGTYIQYYNRLTELSTSMFEWKNLPETVDPRYLEMALFKDGMAVFFEDEAIGYLALRTMIGGQMSVYNIPLIRTAYASNGYQKPLNDKNSVIIFNNYLHTNSMLDVRMFSERLEELDRTIDVNCKAQKTPVLIQCSETQKLVMQNLYQQYDGNQPFIFADNDFNKDGISCIQTGAPYVADKLYQLKTMIWNEALTYLGISNVNTAKKERLVTNEVDTQQGGVIASRYSRLQARREAVDKINAMFGLNIEVNYREDVDHDMSVESENDSNEGGGADNE